MSYFFTPDGVVYRDNDPSVVPGGWTPVSEDEGAARKAQIDAEIDTRVNEALSAENDQRAADYDELIEAGISAGAASRLTGYVPKEN